MNYITFTAHRLIQAGDTLSVNAFFLPRHLLGGPQPTEKRSSPLAEAVRGSCRQSERAFNVALDLAARLGVEMIVLSVARPPSLQSRWHCRLRSRMLRNTDQAQFKSMKEDADKLVGVAVTFHIRVGHPAGQNVRMANEEKADAIVMSTTGE